MQSKKPMYQPWNEEEFQADVFVRGMTWLQRHLYRALLQAAFFHGTRPYLPNDDEVLWVLAGAETPEMWEANKSKILRRFTVAPHDPKLLENKRVTSDWTRLVDARERMSELGQEGAAARTPGVRPVLSMSGGSADGQRTLTERQASEVVVEVEVETREESKETTGGDASSFSHTNLGSDWKSLALRHKRYFGKKASIQFKGKYAEACSKYSEAVVLECFDAWAPGAVGWVRENNVDQPLFSFFKKLPDEAADAVELSQAEAQERTADAAREKQAEEVRNRQQANQQASIERQTAEIVVRMRTHPSQNEESVLDFLSDDETQPSTDNPNRMGADLQTNT